MTRIALLSAVLALGGCATIHDHPYATSFAVAFVAGSIAASSHHDYRDSVAARPATSSTQAPNCSTGLCQ